MNSSYICPRCGNSDPRYIGYLNSRPYCRKCISFSGKHVEEQDKSKRKIALELHYPLSKDQEKVASEVLLNYKEHRNAFIYAVTGAGKTELIYKTVEYALKKHLNVGFAVPRRDVVLDLVPRFQEAFPSAQVTYVIGEHSKVLNGDIIVLTTHQLYRYEHFFDLLIMDEIDAFPYKGTSVLHSFAKKSCRGNYILLSATPNKEDLKEIRKSGKVFTLFHRFHNHPLPVPRFLKSDLFLPYTGYKELRRLLRKNKPVFFFVPTIAIGQSLSKLYLPLLPHGAFVCSESKDREEKIDKFKKGQLSYLITTSILERGVTVKGLQVIVYKADHELYTKEALIQIAGRAGRKKEEPEGEVIFLGRNENESIRSSISEIKRLNKEAGL